MRMSPRHVLASVSALFLFLTVPTAAHANSVIDAFTDAFQVATLPDSTTGPAIWAGTYEPSIFSPFGSQTQPSLPGVFGRYRFTQITATSVVDSSTNTTTYLNYIVATVDTSQRKLRYMTEDPVSSGQLLLYYESSSPVNLSADRYFKVTISGLPTYQYVNLTIGATCGSNTTPSSRQKAITNGTSYFKFSEFSTGCGTFSQVKNVSFTFDASGLNGASFVLSPLHTVYSTSSY